jgi:hypothetical protein
MQLLATFYCQQNNVNYQQGMLEVPSLANILDCNSLLTA